jgi:hypothetical protein
MTTLIAYKSDPVRGAVWVVMADLAAWGVAAGNGGPSRHDTGIGSQGTPNGPHGRSCRGTVTTADRPSRVTGRPGRGWGSRAAARRAPIGAP